jgi:hypothetical protein
VGLPGRADATRPVVWWAPSAMALRPS